MPKRRALLELRETSLELFPNSWTKTRARLASLKNGGSVRQNKWHIHRFLAISESINRGSWTSFAAAAAPAVIKPTTAAWKTEEGHCVSAILWFL